MSFFTETNPFRSCDAYKNGHEDMMPPDFIRGEAYGGSRTGRHLDRIRWFGFQIWLKRFMMCPWTPNDYHRAQKMWTKAGTPLPASLLEMAEECGQYGDLPVDIWALPEGVVVPSGTPLYKVQATDERWGDFANWLESQIRGWGPSTVCTGSYEQREDLRKFYERSGAPMEALEFALHDFGMRGTLTEQESAMAGAAHLVNFLGTDNGEAMGLVEDFYGDDDVGKTIWADEHNITMTWGKHRRKEYIEHLCYTYGTLPNTMVSHVMDTYDQDEEFDLICTEMKPLIEQTFGTTPGCKFVPRPDSGKPEENVVKYPNQMIHFFGNSLEGQHWRKTPDFLGLMQGDGIDRRTGHSCAFSVELAGLRADQVNYGSGGGLLRKCNRDDGGFMMKQNRALFLNSDGSEEWRGTRKVPKSDPSKASKEGDLVVWKDEQGAYHDGVRSDLPKDVRDEMLHVYSPGKLLVDHTFKDVRARA